MFMSVNVDRALNLEVSIVCMLYGVELAWNLEVDSVFISVNVDRALNLEVSIACMSYREEPAWTLRSAACSCPSTWTWC